jgi:HlyD family secretion protein
MNRSFRRWIIWLIGAGLVVAGLVVAFWPQPVPVDMQTIGRGPLLVTVSGTGQVKVEDVYTISAPVHGQLHRIEIQAGDKVFANDTVVASIHEAEPTPLDARTRTRLEAAVKAAEAALALSRAERDKAKAELDFSQTQLKRSQELAARGAVSQAALDRAEMEVHTLEAAYNTAIANVSVRLAEVDQARAALIQPVDDRVLKERSTCCVEVRSPVSGQVLRVLQESETVVEAGAPLLEIGAADNLEVVVDLLSTDAVKVAPGARALIENWGRPGELEGRVSRVEPYAFTKVSALGVEEQRVNVRISIDSKKALAQGLGHGYRVEARIVVADLADIVRVPISALFRDAGQWTVFVVKDGRAERRAVDIGHMNDEHAEVRDGLTPGETVIVYPSDRVTEGTRVIARE